MVVSSRSLPGSPGDVMRRAMAVFIDLVIAVAVILGPLIALDRILAAASVDDLWVPSAAAWPLAFLLLYSPLSVSRWGCTVASGCSAWRSFGMLMAGSSPTAPRWCAT
ncbi:hypothetical protein [Streptomyces sp. NPDC005078]|uniref:hypothetical protein n=1 Tax=unclassified Streptomyces TaxID=2593676 RepID=UPI0033A7D0FA